MFFVWVQIAIYAEIFLRLENAGSPFPGIFLAKEPYNSLFTFLNKIPQVNGVVIRNPTDIAIQLPITIFSNPYAKYSPTLLNSTNSDLSPEKVTL